MSSGRLSSLAAVHVEQLRNQAVEDLEVEIVERKGKGHPDTLIDGAAEAVSIALSNYYLKEYGAVLHHNVDKGLLVGGRSNPRFGGGEVVEPIYICVAGRATSFVTKDGKVDPVPIGRITVSAIRDFLNNTMRFLEPESNVLIDYRIKQGSTDLMSLFDKSTEFPRSNDTSVGVGYAPLTPTEQIVMQVERYLNSSKTKKELPELGEDIKVMGVRNNRKIGLTVASASISHLMPDRSHYENVFQETKSRVEDLVSRITDLNVNVSLNAGDDYSKNVFYLTVTGTSAESGDDGNTGRGNRGNGLIAPMRQYSMEAAAGKNPVNHTGKLFNVLAQRAAERIHREVSGVRDVYVRLLSRIGNPINIPELASAALVLEDGKSVSSSQGDVEGIVSDELSRITELTPKILAGSVSLYY